MLWKPPRGYLLLALFFSPVDPCASPMTSCLSTRGPLHLFLELGSQINEIRYSPLLNYCSSCFACMRLCFRILMLVSWRVCLQASQWYSLVTSLPPSASILAASAAAVGGWGGQQQSSTQAYYSTTASGLFPHYKHIPSSMACLQEAWCLSCSAMETAIFCSHVGHVHSLWMYWLLEPASLPPCSPCRLQHTAEHESQLQTMSVLYIHVYHCYSAV